MINKISFKGYDSRPLKGLMCTDKSCADAINRTLKNSDDSIDIYTPQIASKSIRKEHAQLCSEKKLMWAQDYLTFGYAPGSFVLYDNSRDYSKRVLRATADGLKKNQKIEPFHPEPHIRGGNFFICQKDGKQTMLVCENRQTYPEDFAKKIFNVGSIHEIPKLDYHLDLYIRPLDNGNVLVSDNDMLKDGMKKGMEKIQNYINENQVSKSEKAELENIINNIDVLIQKLEITEEHDPYKQKENTQKVVDAIEKAGLNPIKVPANYYYLGPIKRKEHVEELTQEFKENAKKQLEESKKYSQDIQDAILKILYGQALRTQIDPHFGVEIIKKYENNFLNAITYKKDGKLIYITNAPLLDKTLEITPEIEAKTGFSTKNMFIESVAPYIDKENIHFIDEKTTEKLFDIVGGIHCTAAEIPV